jgi:hypothetical protein
MSTTYYARIIVGSPLEPGKLRIPNDTGTLMCPSGMPGHGTQGRCCSECGKKLEPVVKHLWHAPFIEYANKVAKTSESLLFGQWMDSYRDIGFYNVNRCTTSESNSRLYVLGIPIGEVSSNDYGPPRPPIIFDVSDIEKAMSQISDVMNRLELFKMEPQTYLTMYCSF